MTTAAIAIYALVEQLQADSRPRLVDPARRRRLSGRELARGIELAKGRLQSAGIEPGTTVLFAVRPSAQAIAYLGGLLTIGCRTVLTDLRLPPGLLRTQLSRVGADVVLTERVISLLARQPLRRLLPRRLAPPPIHSFGPRVVTTRPRRAAHRDVPAPEPDSPALVVFTSGTTDVPKAVVHSQASLGAMFTALVDQMGAGAGTVVYSDQFHSIIPAMAAGATCIIGVPTLGDEATAHVLHDEKVDVWFTTPSRAREVVRLLTDARPLRVVLGSAPVTAPLVDELTRTRPGLEVTAVYGMTEAVPIAVADGRSILDHSGPGDLVGSLAAGIELRLGDDGEVWLRGPRVGHYLDGDSGWVATGDLGYRRADGRLVLNGRSKDMILRAGRNVYPQHYEPALAAIEGVGGAAMVGLPDRYGDEEIWLVVETVRSPAEIAPVVRDHPILDSLDVAGVVFADLPRSRRGKLDRNACRELIAAARTDGTAAMLDRL